MGTKRHPPAHRSKRLAAALREKLARSEHRWQLVPDGASPKPLPLDLRLRGGSQLAYILAMLYVAVLFGFGHCYKGPAGVLDSMYSGLVLGGAYLLTGRNLWAPILAHGISDTLAILVVYMGWAS